MCFFTFMCQIYPHWSLLLFVALEKVLQLKYHDLCICHLWIHIVELYVFTADLSKARFYIWTIHLLLASTFKPNGSSLKALTKIKKRETMNKDWESESNLVKALVSSQKFAFPSTRPIWSLSFSKLNAPCKIECVPSPKCEYIKVETKSIGKRTCAWWRWQKNVKNGWKVF